MVLLAGLMLAAIVSVSGCAWLSNSAQTAYQETAPSTLLEKYTWFKEASASLDNKKATIEVFEAKIVALNNSYAGMNRTEWRREDLEQYNQWISEQIGVKASYNTLAAQYNARMVEINWAFCNQGDMPKGLEGQPALPREYRSYIVS
jgi:hypothetical protein